MTSHGACSKSTTTIAYRLQVAFGLKVTLAGDAVVMSVRLAIMLLQAAVVDEDATAFLAVKVVFHVVTLEVVAILEVLIAVLAVGVLPALHVVLFQTEPSRKVHVTIIADVMVR